MRFIVGLALSRRSVTLMASLLVLAAGAFTYSSLPVELFPEVEFPLVTVTAFYPSANPDAVARDVATPIENAISGVDGLDSLQSISAENRALILANFELGTDMKAAESAVSASIQSLTFPDGVRSPTVSRISPDRFPVLQLSVTGDRDLAEIQRIVEEKILPELSGIDDVVGVEVAGGVRQRALVSVDEAKMAEKGVTLFQISQALRENNVTLPGGVVFDGGTALPVKTTNSFDSLDELRGLVVGVSAPGGAPQGLPAGVSAQGGAQGMAPGGGPNAAMGTPVTLGEVAEVTFGNDIPTSISRTNGKRGLVIGIIKEPDANAIDVTDAALAAIDGIADGLPADIDMVVVSNDGPEIKRQIATLEREAILGLLLAVTVVFAFFITLRPTALRGILSTLRPTLVIALSIPMSILMGVLLLNWQGLTLNFMTLGGLAISVGRVVDDSIVVLENVYRNIERGGDRWRAALEATAEVGPAITASTLATIVVFAPLAFIQGLVGEFFFPFALTVSFALAASLLVSLTAVPVLGAYLLRPGDLPEGAGEGDELPERETWMQRAYTPALRWALRHRAIALGAVVLITAGSAVLIGFIPVSLFPEGGERYLTVDMSLPPGSPATATLAQVNDLETAVAGYSEFYVTTIGTPESALSATGSAAFGGFNQSSTFVKLREDAPADVEDRLREALDGVEDRLINVTAISQGPPSAGLDVLITGPNYDDISAVARTLEAELKEVEGVENVVSDVTEARDEVVVNVDPAKAAALGLSARQVAFQVNQYLVVQTVTQVNAEGRAFDVQLAGRPAGVVGPNGSGGVGALMIAGPGGVAPLSEIAAVEVTQSAATIVRTDGERSARLSGSIVSGDQQTVGRAIQEKIDAVALPPGVAVVSGGVFAQIAEGFQDIFLAMAIGLIMVYLVMVASLGSLRNPIVIVSSLPLASIGALVALAVTGRSLGLPGMMGVLMLIGIVVTNAVVLISFVEQLRQRHGLSVDEALILGGRIRLRPILMTALTTSIALLPLAAFSGNEGGIISAELATVVIGGLISSTVLTLVVVPIVYTLAHRSIPGLFRRVFRRGAGVPQPEPEASV